MNGKHILGAALLALALPACAAPSKVMVANSFSGDDKMSKILILDAGQIDPSTKKRLFNVYVRVCDIDAKNHESKCKDTTVLQNVVPGTVY
ncbi:MAG: hypothetical protein QM820_09415 [Minicystis sp.]